MSLQDTPFIADTKEVIADAITTSGGLLTADDVAGEAARGVLCTIVKKNPQRSCVRAHVCGEHAIVVAVCWA